MAHEHRYYMQSVKKEFETWDKTVDGTQLYIMVEYAYMFCAGCLSTIKVEVKQEEPDAKA